MSNSKYDWEPYLPRMIQLYLDGKPISDIHAAIQDPAHGFEPGPRRVYDILNERCYPTKPKERKLFLQHYHDMAWQNSMLGADLHSVENPLLVPCLPSNDDSHESHMTFTANPSGSLPVGQDSESSYVDASSNSDGFDNERNKGQDMSQATNLPGSSPESSETGFWESFLYENGMATENEEHIPAQFDFQHDEFDLRAATGTAASTMLQHQSPEDSITQQAGDSGPDFGSDLVIPTGSFEAAKASSVSSTYDHLPAVTSLSRPSSRTSNQRPSAAARKPLKNDATISSCIAAMLPSRFRIDRSSSPNKRVSTSTRDSGYVSGRNSPFSQIEEEHTDTQPSEEFKTLYRVPCRRHEPQPAIILPTTPAFERQSKAQYKNVATCPDCLYSAVHNLSWSANHLKLQVFQTELMLNFYNSKALDIVGNSALHYAAAGGAGSEHFVSLIKAGVNPYHLNTEGQLFLHCLRLDESAGPDGLKLLSMDLVILLNSLEPRGAFASMRWRDNAGRTILDTLATYISNPEMKTQTFQLIQNAGYPLELSQQFPETVLGDRISHAQVDPGSNSGFSVTQDRQRKAYEILGRAVDLPSYVDPETGDNDFVSKDVDLNLQNRDSHSPLAAFIQGRPFLGIESEETGATMSKYLDALLWKDIRRRIPNKINVNMRNREGAPALYYAAVRARPDSVRSLIDAGANVNACLNINGCSQSILQATLNARSGHVNNPVKMHLYKEVISYLEHEGAVSEPSLLQERGLCANSVMIMPM
ncbi:hypothetical protein EG329_006449 [Mollisiaceae sp. DMI_Dod_QoI]|nr:hypothetical protein EG329_006449 [Helotiales sp. DMI_Dod_QoI]